MTEGGATFVGSAQASARDRRRALALVAAIVLAFLVTAPFADRPLAAVPAFVPVYDSALLVLSLVTAMLLYAQYLELGERRFLALGCGYLFAAVLAGAHAVSFPGAFVPGYLIGGEQTTVWLWMAWHGLFPLFVAAYALLARSDREGNGARPYGLRSGAAVLLTLALAAGAILITTAGEPILPDLMLGDLYRSPSTRLIFALAWITQLAALALLLWSTRGRRLIDVWLAVTLLVGLLDLALSAILVSGRFQLGFYAGRFYGLLASSFVLILLLRQAVGLHGSLARASGALRDSEERLRLIVGNARDYAIFIIDPEARVIDWREGAETVFGFSREEMIGRDVEILYTPEDRAAGEPEKERAIARAEGKAPDVRWHVCKGGRRVFLDGIVTALRDSEGRLTGYLKIGQDVTERHAAEQRQKTLLAELQHRVRNTLAVVRSIVRRTAQNSGDLEEMVDHLQGRIDAFARVQAVVTRDVEGGVDLTSLIEDELIAHATPEGRRLKIDGPDLLLLAKPAETLSLAIHELATNSVKYGALGTGDGMVRVRWTTNGAEGAETLHFTWTEQGRERPLVAAERTGFGFELLQRTLPYELDAETEIHFEREGLRFTLRMPLKDKIAEPDALAHQRR